MKPTPTQHTKVLSPSAPHKTPAQSVQPTGRQTGVESALKTEAPPKRERSFVQNMFVPMAGSGLAQFFSQPGDVLAAVKATRPDLPKNAIPAYLKLGSERGHGMLYFETLPGNMLLQAGKRGSRFGAQAILDKYIGSPTDSFEVAILKSALSGSVAATASGTATAFGEFHQIRKALQLPQLSALTAYRPGVLGSHLLFEGSANFLLFGTSKYLKQTFPTPTSASSGEKALREASIGLASITVAIATPQFTYNAKVQVTASPDTVKSSFQVMKQAYRSGSLYQLCTDNLGARAMRYGPGYAALFAINGALHDMWDTHASPAYA